MEQFADIQKMIKDIISDITEIPSHHIDTKKDLENYGVDSLLSVVIAEGINRKYGQEIFDLDNFSDYSNIDDVSYGVLEILTTTQSTGEKK